MRFPEIPSGADVLRRAYTVRAGDADGGGRLTPSGFCEMFFDAAGRHAHALGVSVDDLIARGHTWMLSRFAFRVEAYPRRWDDVTVSTWPSGRDRLFAYRDFLATGPDGVPFGGGSTAWLVIDLDARRPLRISDVLDEHKVWFPEGLPEHHPEKLPDAGIADAGAGIPVRWDDIDFNEHVTSGSYIRWALEAVPPDVRSTRALRAFTINYLSETFHGETVTTSSAADGSVYRHAIRSADGRELVRARSEWV